jgi:hypothetical protein
MDVAVQVEPALKAPPAAAAEPQVRAHKDVPLLQGANRTVEQSVGSFA